MLLLLLLFLLLDTPVTGPSPTPTGPLSTSGDGITAAACTCVYNIHVTAHAKRIKLHHDYALGHTYVHLLYTANTTNEIQYVLYIHHVSHRFIYITMLTCTYSSITVKCKIVLHVQNKHL